jgi:hypothetical protein
VLEEKLKDLRIVEVQQFINDLQELIIGWQSKIGVGTSADSCEDMIQFHISQGYEHYHYYLSIIGTNSFNPFAFYQ